VKKPAWQPGRGRQRQQTRPRTRTGGPATQQPRRTRLGGGAAPAKHPPGTPQRTRPGPPPRPRASTHPPTSPRACPWTARHPSETAQGRALAPAAGRRRTRVGCRRLAASPGGPRAGTWTPRGQGCRGARRMRSSRAAEGQSETASRAGAPAWPSAQSAGCSCPRSCHGTAVGTYTHGRVALRSTSRASARKKAPDTPPPPSPRCSRGGLGQVASGTKQAAGDTDRHSRGGGQGRCAAGVQP
jgi:hypothetical protein